MLDFNKKSRLSIGIFYLELLFRSDGFKWFCAVYYQKMTVDDHHKKSDYSYLDYVNTKIYYNC